MSGATDRAREAVAKSVEALNLVRMEHASTQDWSRHYRASARVEDIAGAIFLPALDFADAVEAALPHNAALSPTDKAIRKALYTFLAQLDRATGGGA